MSKIKLIIYKEYEDNTILFSYRPQTMDEAHVLALDFLGELGIEGKEVCDDLDVYLGDIKNDVYYYYNQDYKIHVIIVNDIIFFSVQICNERIKYALKDKINRFFEK